MLPVANILQPLIDIFEPVLVWFHDLFGSWGVAIIMLTVVVRALILPLAVRQYRSMRKLQEVAPEMKKIQEKYKDDKQRQQQELMRFYQENKINPLGSCLPLLAQLPVFLALFYLLQNDLRVEICGQDEVPCGDVGNPVEFLFITDLTAKATGAVLVALILLYIVSQLGSSLLMAVSADKNQRIIMFTLPFLFVAFIWNFPAGLLVYWITTNFWTVLQQLIIRRIVGAPVKPAVALAGAGSGDSGGGGGGGGGEPSPDGGNGRRASGATPPPPRPRKKKKKTGRRR